MHVHTTRVRPYVEELAKGQEHRVKVPDTRTFYRDMLEVLGYHAGLRAAASHQARAMITPPLQLIRDERYDASDLQRRRLEQFLFLGGDRSYENILDFFGFSSKLFLTVGYFQTVGQAAWWVLRNQDGVPIGWDFLIGLVVPQVDVNSGKFKEPAYHVYTPDRLLQPIKVSKPSDLVLFLHPSLAGRLWGSDVEALMELTLPSDISAQEAYLSMHRDRTAPYDGIWQIPADSEDEEYDRVDAMLKARYNQFAANPLLARGALKFEPIRRNADEAPYLDGRRIARTEIAGVTGVFGAQMGDTEGTTFSNMREIRRSWYEMTQLPLARMLEDIIWEQVCIRLFRAPGWRPQWLAPDFLTMVEKAAVAARGRQWGLMSSNEARKLQGMQPRDGGDDDYILPSNVAPVSPVGGAPDETRPEQGELEPAEEDPTGAARPPDVRPDEEQRARELDRWRRLALLACRKGGQWKRWEPRHIAPMLAEAINAELATAWPDAGIVTQIFDAAKEIAHAADGSGLALHELQT